jgi:rhamnopyranosyl-N-acetylglucosaminyl-diphospho-decaprenol beta-1,3/1,4-galactofuranosyltransferase
MHDQTYSCLSPEMKVSFLNADCPVSELYSPHKTSDIVAIVVTHNRQRTLANCIHALLNQEKQCDIILVDNASTDGTRQYIKGQLLPQNEKIHYIQLRSNIGGAGGFHHGMKYAISRNWQWLWLMDDDAEPDEAALKTLMLHVHGEQDIYGSIAVDFDSDVMRLCWPPEVLESKYSIKSSFIASYDQLSDSQELAGLPFLGFLIHRGLAKKIGLPNPNLFIYSDDQEYCERAKKKGARIFLIRDSIIYHPLPANDLTTYSLWGNKIAYRSLPHWKVYYYVRNKIIIGKRFYGKRFITQTIPGAIFRFVVSMLREQNRLTFLHAYIMAFFDGLRGRTIMRILPPGIPDENEKGVDKEMGCT